MSKKAVINAVNEAGSEVTVADVVTKTGLPPDAVSKWLNTIASETGGTLSVTDNGTIVYCFDDKIQLRYFARGIKRSALAVARTVFEMFYLLFRLSFGLTLICSILLVYSVVWAFYSILGVLTGAGEGADRMKDDFVDLFKKMALTELFLWDRKKDPASRPRGFLMNCFAYLFGEGDPNRDIDEYRWRLLAQVIRENEGVVTAEQLAPYFGRDPDQDRHFLSVLAHFDGMAAVTESGFIVYVFPSLMVGRGEILQETLPLALEEKNWKFTSMPNQAMRGVFIMVALNVIGSALLLWYWLQVPAEKHWTGLPLVAFVIAVYGMLFLLIPLLRLAAIQLLNKGVTNRNAAYQSYADYQGNSNDLKLKLLEAEQVRRQERPLGTNKVVYSTDRDNLDQADYQ